jgi:hypothetical protein
MFPAFKIAMLRMSDRKCLLGQRVISIKSLP